MGGTNGRLPSDVMDAEENQNSFHLRQFTNFHCKGISIPNCGSSFPTCTKLLPRQKAMFLALAHLGLKLHLLLEALLEHPIHPPPGAPRVGHQVQLSSWEP